jgi:hypothetical protein
MFGGQGTVFGGSPLGPVPTFNVAEALGMSGGSAVLVNSLMQSIVPTMFGAKNVQFGQFMPQMNLYDQFKQRAAFDMQQSMVKDASVLDQRTYEQMFKGFANLTGTPFGVREQAAAGTMAKDLSSIMPMLMHAAPDLVDRMHGSRGSAAVMAQRMALGSRYMTDPLSGTLGMSSDSAKAMHKNVFESLFGQNADISQMRGITAGQAGSMFDEMSRRGVIGSGQRSLSEIAKSKISNKEEFSTEKLLSLPDFNDRVQKFEADRVVDKIKGMTGAISAVKDIFGENGRADAPMSELFNALQKITQNNMSNMNPADVERMVRNASNAAKMTGMGLEGMMGNIAGAGQVADKFGLSRSFATRFATNSALYAQAHSSIFGGVEGFDTMGKEEVLGVRRQMMAAAAASPQANSMAALIRAVESGAIDANKNPEVAAYVGRLKAGTAEFKTSEQIMDMASKAGMNSNSFRALQGQTTSNQAVIAQNKLDTLVAGDNQREEVRAMTKGSFAMALAMDGFSDKEVEGISETVSKRLVKMDRAEMAAYNKSDLGFLMNDLKKQFPNIPEKKLRAALELGRADLDTEASVGGYKTGANMLSLVNEGVAKQEARNIASMEAESRMQTAMSGLNRSAPTQRLADILINNPGNREIGDIVREAFGGISEDKIRALQKAGGADIDKIRRLKESKSPLQASGIIDQYLKNGAGAAEAKEIAAAYGIDLESLRGKSPEDIQHALSMSASNIQRGLAEKLPQFLSDAGIETATSQITSGTINAVRNAANTGEANAGGLAMSLADAILSDSGATSMLTEGRAADITGMLRGAGNTLEALSGSKATVDGMLKFTTDPRAAAIRRSLQGGIADRTATDAALKDIAKRGGVSVDDIRSQIGATTTDKAALNRTGLLAELKQAQAEVDAAEAEIVAAGNDPDKKEQATKKKQAAEEKRKNIEAKIRAHAQQNGYSAESVLSEAFKSKLSGADQAKARSLLDQRNTTNLKMVEDARQAAALGNISDVLGGDDKAAEAAAALRGVVEDVAGEFGGISKTGNIVRTTDEMSKVDKSIRRQKEMAEKPGEHLDTLLRNLQGVGNTTMSEAVKAKMEAMSAGGKAVLGRNLEAIEKLTGKGEGQLGVGLDVIKGIYEGKTDLRSQSAEVQSQFRALDPEALKALATGNWAAADFEKKAKDEVEQKKKDNYTYVRLDDNTKLSGTLDLVTNNLQLTVNSGSRA